MSAMAGESSSSSAMNKEPSSSDNNTVEEMGENNDSVTIELYNDMEHDISTLPFVPEAHGLPSHFRLTNFGSPDSGVNSSETTPSRENNEFFMAIFNEDQVAENEMVNQESTMIFGKKTLCTRMKQFNTHLIETSNTLTPFIENPYAMGKIACLSILNGIYALGIVDITTIRMNLALPSRMELNEKEVVIPMISNGFKDAAKESGNNVKCVDITTNRSLLIGGTASAICTVDEFIPPDGAEPGDVIVLTKPLGTLVALRAAQWLEHPEKRRRLLRIIDEASVEKAKLRAIDSMLRSNKEDAILMRQYNARAACEVSSQGILGHAMMLAKAQKNAVELVIHNLPIIAKMKAVSILIGDSVKLLGGSLPEYSGGFIIVLPREHASTFCKVHNSTQHRQAWVVGLVQKGERNARVIDKPKAYEVPAKESDLLLW